MRTHRPESKEYTHRLPVRLLINVIAHAAIFMIVALLSYRFAGAFAWRSFLVLFLFIAAGLYIVFAVQVGEGIIWVVGELVGVAIFCGMAPLGLRGSLWCISGYKTSSVSPQNLIYAELPISDTLHK